MQPQTQPQVGIIMPDGSLNIDEPRLLEIASASPAGFCLGGALVEEVLRQG